MKNIILVLLLATGSHVFAQSGSVSVIDFVKIKDAKTNEAIYFYENNWKVYRDTAINRGYIKSYHLLTTTADTTANFDIMLVTEYADSTQLSLSEPRFNDIIKQLRPAGPKLLNDIKPNDFRKNIFSKKAVTKFDAED